MPTTGITEFSRSTRVLVFAVDDGSLCVDIDRVDTVYARSEARLHTLKDADALSCSFLIHRGEPDLRRAFSRIFTIQIERHRTVGASCRENC